MKDKMPVSDMQEKKQMGSGGVNKESNPTDGEIPPTVTFESTSGKNVSQVSYRKEAYYPLGEK